MFGRAAERKRAAAATCARLWQSTWSRSTPEHARPAAAVNPHGKQRLCCFPSQQSRVTFARLCPPSLVCSESHTHTPSRTHDSGAFFPVLATAKPFDAPRHTGVAGATKLATTNCAGATRILLQTPCCWWRWWTPQGFALHGRPKRAPRKLMPHTLYFFLVSRSPSKSLLSTHHHLSVTHTSCTSSAMHFVCAVLVRSCHIHFSR